MPYQVPSKVINAWIPVIPPEIASISRYTKLPPVIAELEIVAEVNPKSLPVCPNSIVARVRAFVVAAPKGSVPAWTNDAVTPPVIEVLSPTSLTVALNGMNFSASSFSSAAIPDED